MGKKKQCKIKSRYKLKPLYVLDANFTQIANTMFRYIPNGNDFKVYCYLCFRYNRDYQYAFPSLNTISNETCLSLSTVKRSIKWLESKRFIVRIGYNKITGANCYQIRCVYDDVNNEYNENFIAIPYDKEEDAIEYCNEVKKKHSNKTKRKSNYEYTKWRNKVLKRDNYICRLCGKTDEECILNVHHIVKYADNEELRTDVNNGITLCYECHKKIFGKEEEFEEYFKQLIKEDK